MIGLFCFTPAVLASPFRSKLRIEAENAVLRHQFLIVLRRRPRGRVRLTNHDRGFFPAVLPVSSNPDGSHNHPARDASALAQSRLPLEVAPTATPTAERDGAARIDPVDERRKSALRRATQQRELLKLGL